MVGIDSFEIDTDQASGQALQFADRLVGRAIGRHATDLRVFGIEHVEQQKVGAVAGRQFGIGHVIEQRLHGDDALADQHAPFARLQRMKQRRLVQRGHLGRGTIEKAFDHLVLLVQQKETARSR